MTDFETNPVGTMQELHRVRAERDALAAHVDRLQDALDHIRRTAHKSRTQTTRLRFISKRAGIALDGQDFSYENTDLPKSAPSTAGLELRLKQANKEAKAIQGERDALAAHVERLREGLHHALVHWGANVADEDGTAYAECEKRCNEAPATSLTRLKAEWLEDLLNSIPYKDLHTNNGDMRQDAHYRDGWNSCREHFRRQVEGEHP